MRQTRHSNLGRFFDRRERPSEREAISQKLGHRILYARHFAPQEGATGGKPKGISASEGVLSSTNVAMPSALPGADAGTATVGKGVSEAAARVAGASGKVAASRSPAGRPRSLDPDLHPSHMQQGSRFGVIAVSAVVAQVEPAADPDQDEERPAEGNPPDGVISY
ncbi:MAG: hypothetical protein ACREFP_07165 [Acetobacteraceae bacterium]